MKESQDLDKMPVVAVFDFDGTLTYADSFLPFLRETTTRTTFLFRLLFLTPTLLTGFFRGFSRNRLKEHLIRHFLCGKTEDELQRVSSRYCAGRLRKLMNPVALKQLGWHHQQGHRVILLSASPETYLKWWAAENGISEVLATRIHFVDNLVTGLIDGQNCRGLEKVKRLEAHLGRMDRFTIYAYGDSTADLPLLHRVAHPFYRSFAPANWLKPILMFVVALV